MAPWICFRIGVEVKNISFMQLVLGTTGAILIYSGIKDIDIMTFFSDLIRDPKKAFTNNYSNNDKLLKPGETGGGTKGDKPLLHPPNFNPLGSSNTNPKPSGNGFQNA